MITSRLRTPAVLTGLAVLAGSVLLPVSAHAEEGPPPASQTRTAISNVHTDAVSTFVDDGRLVLATKADIGGIGIRQDPDTTFVNVEEASRIQVPAAHAYSFLGDAGSDLWLAPEVQQQGIVWPGFSTESVPRGTFDGDKVTVALTDWEGPGDLEVWDSSGSFGAPGRIFSTREGSGLSNSYTFAVPQHKHANWGFSAAGEYTLTFTATATVGGATQTATQDYTFVVGDVPAAVSTTTGLSLSARDAVLGDTVTATATVSPASSEGWVEFLDGSTTLGHAAVADGLASLDLTGIGLGEHSVTARFVPAWTNDFTASTSAAAPLTVIEDAGGDVFSVRGIATSYTSGDRLEARVAGITLADDEVVRWVVAPTDAPDQDTYFYGDDQQLLESPTIERVVDTSYDGYSIKALVSKKNSYTALQETAYVPITVTGDDGGSGIPITLEGLDEDTVHYTGDVVEVTTDAELEEGQSWHWVRRYSPVFPFWQDLEGDLAPAGDNPFLVVPSNYYANQLALQIRDASEAVVGQSAPTVLQSQDREVQFAGLQSVYRAGDTLSVSADVYPAVDGVSYAWSTVGDSGLVPIEGATTSTLTLPVTADMDGETIYFQATEPRVGASVAFSSFTIRVTDADAGEQVIYFDSLAGHYHQGNTITMHITSDPEPADTDTFSWSWKRPDQSEWQPIEASGDTYEVRAQQALDGTEVRSDLLDASGAVLASAEPVTIHVDDHGAPAAEKATVTGLADHYHSGDDITLSASVAPESVLDRWEWYVQKAGETTPLLVADANGPELTLEASDELAGAAVFARLTFDDGTAYVESPAVIIEIDDHEHEVPATELSIETNRDPSDYWAGQTATLTAKQSVPTGLTEYRWLVKAPGAADFTVAQGKVTEAYTFKPNPANSGTQVKVQLLHDGEVHAESAPVTFTAGQRDAVTTISVTGDKTEYEVGDIAHFVSAQDPMTDHDHFHWYIKRAGSADFVWVDQSREADLDLPITAAEDGAQLIIRMFDETHATIAESAPVTLEVAGVTGPVDPTDPVDLTDPGTDAGKPATPPQARTEADLAGVASGGLSLSTTTAEAGSVVTIGLGADKAGSWNAAWLFSSPTLLGGDWLQADSAGRLAVTIPADAELREHRIAVFDAEGALVGWQSITVTAASPMTSATAGQLASTGQQQIVPVTVAALLLMLGAGVILVRRRRQERDV